MTNQPNFLFMPNGYATKRGPWKSQIPGEPRREFNWLVNSYSNWYAITMAALDWLSFCGLCAAVIGVFLLIGAAVWEEMPGEHRRTMWAGLTLVVTGLALQLWIGLAL